VRFAGWGAQSVARMGGCGAPGLTQSSLAVGVVGVAYVDQAPTQRSGALSRSKRTALKHRRKGRR
jgi:hypothetical protein